MGAMDWVGLLGKPIFAMSAWFKSQLLFFQCNFLLMDSGAVDDGSTT